MRDPVAHCAAVLSNARLRRRRLAMLAPDVRPNDETGAYAIQEAAHRLLCASGRGEIVGHKIGCTTPVMQAFLGIANPCAGGIFSPTVYRDSVELKHSDFLHVGVECEIAVRLERDLPAGEAPFDRSKVGAAPLDGRSRLSGGDFIAHRRDARCAGPPSVHRAFGFDTRSPVSRRICRISMPARSTLQRITALPPQFQARF